MDDAVRRRHPIVVVKVPPRREPGPNVRRTRPGRHTLRPSSPATPPQNRTKSTKSMTRKAPPSYIRSSHTPRPRTKGTKNPTRNAVDRTSGLAGTGDRTKCTKKRGRKAPPSYVRSGHTPRPRTKSTKNTTGRPHPRTSGPATHPNPAPAPAQKYEKHDSDRPTLVHPFRQTASTQAGLAGGCAQSAFSLDAGRQHAGRRSGGQLPPRVTGPVRSIDPTSPDPVAPH